LGGAEGIAAKAAENMAKKYQGLEIAGVHHGYFDETEEPKIIEHIRESGASFLLVALGVPKQEIWMNRHREELEGIVAIGVGGSFDVLSGKLRRAPLIWQRLGLEWLFRLIQEPWRWRRVKALPLFGILVLLTKLGFDRGWYEDGN
jgi:N-acetylglucosaminyldiphosphoundecaprenol N-acetyl-beta-D-mannosaminyltransferase